MKSEKSETKIRKARKPKQDKTPKMEFPEDQAEAVVAEVVPETPVQNESVIAVLVPEFLTEEKNKSPRILVPLTISLSPDELQTLQTSGVITLAEARPESTKEYVFQVSKSCEKRFVKTRLLKLSKKQLKALTPRSIPQ